MLKIDFIMQKKIIQTTGAGICKPINESTSRWDRTLSQRSPRGPTLFKKQFIGGSRAGLDSSDVDSVFYLFLVLK